MNLDELFRDPTTLRFCSGDDEGGDTGGDGEGGPDEPSAPSEPPGYTGDPFTGTYDPTSISAQSRGPQTDPVTGEPLGPTDFPTDFPEEPPAPVSSEFDFGGGSETGAAPMPAAPPPPPSVAPFLPAPVQLPRAPVGLPRVPAPPPAPPPFSLWNLFKQIVNLGLMVARFSGHPAPMIAAAVIRGGIMAIDFLNKNGVTPTTIGTVFGQTQRGGVPGVSSPVSSVGGQPVGVFVPLAANVLNQIVTTAAAIPRSAGGKLLHPSDALLELSLLNSIPLNSLGPSASTLQRSFISQVGQDFADLPAEEPLWIDLVDYVASNPDNPAAFQGGQDFPPDTTSPGAGNDFPNLGGLAELQCICDALNQLVATIQQRPLLTPAAADNPKVVDQQTKLAEAFVKGNLMASEIDARNLENLLPSLEEWFRLVDHSEDIPQDDTQVEVNLNSDAIQHWSESGSGDPVQNKPIDTQPRVITVDNISLFLADSMEGTLWKKGMVKVLKILAAVVGIEIAESELANEALKPLFSKVTSMMQDFLYATPVVTPDTAFEQVTRYFQEAVKLGTEAHLLSIALEASSYTKHFGFQQIAGFVAELAAFGEIAKETWGQASKAAMGRPLEYKMNSLTRSHLPSDREIRDGWSHRIISEDKTRETLAFHGFSEEWIEHTLKFDFRPSNLREVILLALDSSITEDIVVDMLQFGGYRPKDIDLMTPLVFQQAIKSQRQSLLTEIQGGLKDGVMTRESAEALWDQLHLQQEARALASYTAHLGFTRELIAEQQKGLLALYDGGITSDADLQLSLEAIGIDGQKASAIVGSHSSRRSAQMFKKETAAAESAVRKVQSASIATLKEQFSLGLIDAPLMTVMLLASGVAAALAKEIVSLEQIKRDGKSGSKASAQVARLANQIVVQRRDAFDALYQKGAITVAELRDNLSALGIDAKLVDAEVDREIAKSLKAPKAPAH